jgi:hypothetical protein
MTRFVEIESCGGEIFHINPDHVAAVLRIGEKDDTVTSIIMAIRQKMTVTNPEAPAWQIHTYEPIDDVMRKLNGG